MKLKLLLIVFAASFISASAQLKIGDQPTLQQKSVALDVKGSNGKQGLWLPRVTDTTDVSGIDGLTPPDGMLIYYTPSQNLMARLNGYWVSLIKTDTAINNIYANGITKVTGPNINLKVGNSPGATNDFNLVGSTALKEITINLPDASATARGAVTMDAQTFSGSKTFGNGVIVNNSSTLNNGTTANGGLTVSGATTNTSSLTLGVTSATAPAAQTDKYLSVNASGNVTLNSLNAITSVNTGGTPMTGPALTYNTGNTGTDFNISSTGNTATWNLPNASATARGAVTTTAQTFAGGKTFSNGATVNSGLSVTGATANASSLTLGITSTTPTTLISNNLLTVDAVGKVVLSTTNIEANKPSRVLNYTLTISGTNLAANSTMSINTALPAAANVSFPASVFFSPAGALSVGTTIDWATIINNNLVAAISTRANTQDFTNYVFYVTIVDF